MLNALIDKYIIEFSNEFFDTNYAKKYTNFLYNLNTPIKDLQTHFYESFQGITIPGLTVQPTVVSNLNNLNNVNFGNGKPNNMTETSIDRQYIGNLPFNQILNSNNITINCRNTYINWMYSYEFFRDYFDRKRTVKDFKTTITVYDAGNIPMLMFIFSDCFINSLPDLEFLTNQAIREPRNFDLGLIFNKFDVKFLIPNFDVDINNNIII